MYAGGNTESNSDLVDGMRENDGPTHENVGEGDPGYGWRNGGTWYGEEFVN